MRAGILPVSRVPLKTRGNDYSLLTIITARGKMVSIEVMREMEMTTLLQKYTELVERRAHDFTWGFLNSGDKNHKAELFVREQRAIAHLWRYRELHGLPAVPEH